MSSVTFSTDDFLVPSSPMSTASMSPVYRSPSWPPPVLFQCTKKQSRVLIEEVEESDHQESPSPTHAWVQAENVVYEVHRDFLGPKPVVGLRCAPFYLKGITSTEMDGFLEVADTRTISNTPLFTVSQCVGAISVAEFLEFDKLRAYAVAQLEGALHRLDPISCIEIATEYHNRAWLMEGLSRLCLRDEPLSFSEALRVPQTFAIAIVAIREELIWFRNQLDLKFVLPYIEEPPLETAMWNRALGLVEGNPVFTSMDVKSPESQREPKCLPCKRRYCSIEYRPAMYTTYLVAGHSYELPSSYFRGASKLITSTGSNGWVTILPQDVTASDWETYLSILVARPYNKPSFHLTFSSWMNALRLAANIQHDDMQRYILDQIESDWVFMDEDPLTLIEAAFLGNRPSAVWVEYQYMRLAERRDPISIEEGLRLNAASIVRIARLREERAYRSRRARAAQ